MDSLAPMHILCWESWEAKAPELAEDRLVVQFQQMASRGGNSPRKQCYVRRGVVKRVRACAPSGASPHPQHSTTIRLQKKRVTGCNKLQAVTCLSDPKMQNFMNRFEEWRVQCVAEGTIKDAMSFFFEVSLLLGVDFTLGHNDHPKT